MPGCLGGSQGDVGMGSTHRGMQGKKKAGKYTKVLQRAVFPTICSHKKKLIGDAVLAEHSDLKELWKFF